MKCINCKFAKVNPADPSDGQCTFQLPAFLLIRRTQAQEARGIWVHEFGDGCDLGQSYD